MGRPAGPMAWKAAASAATSKAKYPIAPMMTRRSPDRSSSALAPTPSRRYSRALRECRPEPPGGGAVQRALRAREGKHGDDDQERRDAGQKGHGERGLTGQHSGRDAEAGDRDGDEADQAGDQEQGNGPAGRE